MSEQEILDATNEIMNDIQRNAAFRIVQCFTDAGLPIKVKRLSRAKPNDRFRIFCFAGKVKESVVINTDMWGFDGLRIQMRITNPDSFARLDELSENIRKQIIGGRDCNYCWDKCNGKQYAFSHNGMEYIKCQNFGCNFKFKIESEDDIISLIALAQREIDLANTKEAQ